MTEYLLALVLFWFGGLNVSDQSMRADVSNGLGSYLTSNGLGPNWPFGPGDPFGPGGPHGPGNPGPPLLPWPPVTEPLPEFSDWDFGTLPPLVLPPVGDPPVPHWEFDPDVKPPRPRLKPWEPGFWDPNNWSGGSICGTGTFIW